MKAFAGMFVGGTITLILLKLLAAWLLPLLGAALGFVFTLVKLTLLVAVAWLIYSMVTKRKREREQEVA